MHLNPNIRRSGTDSSLQHKIMKYLQRNSSTVVAWGIFFTVSLLVYFVFSNGDFSFILTYAAFVRLFAFILLIMKLFKSNNASGISLKMLQLYSIVFVARLLSIIQYNGYLPFDKSGDYFYHLVEVGSLIGVIVVMSCLYTKFKLTYDEQFDSFGNSFKDQQLNKIGALIWCAGPCLLLAITFHPNLNQNFFADTAWAFSMFLESVAFLPQLYMFNKNKTNVIEGIIAHCVCGLGVARFLEMIFWLRSYHELVNHSNSTTVGIFVLFAQFVHLVLMIDFFYLYFISLKRGLPMTLPGRMGGLV